MDEGWTPRNDYSGTSPNRLAFLLPGQNVSHKLIKKSGDANSITTL
jgi:hypothetical protein